MTHVLVIDNYDSFVYTLAGYLHQLGARVTVLRNDDFAADAAASTIAAFDAVLLSPGPGRPADAGVSIPVVHAAAGAGMPLLGVCLGHQAIAEAFGGRVARAEEPMHGRTSRVVHDGIGLYAGLPQGFAATRYHSLLVADASMPDELVVTSRVRVGGADGSQWRGAAQLEQRGVPGPIMGLRHRELPIEGVQFHPESVLTEGGYAMLGNWLVSAGLAGAAAAASRLAPLRV